MSQLLVIACGGALGAVCRFLLSGAVYSLAGRQFPWGTLTVNVLGSFVMGLAVVWFLGRSDASLARDAITIGFLGSLTTFSTFSIETLQLLQDGSFVHAMMNIALSVVVCISACLVGILCARALGWQ